MKGGFPIIAPHEIIAPHYGIITMIGGIQVMGTLNWGVGGAGL